MMSGIARMWSSARGPRSNPGRTFPILGASTPVGAAQQATPVEAAHWPETTPVGAAPCYALGQSRITWAFFTVNEFIGIALFVFALAGLAARGLRG